MIAPLRPPRSRRAALAGELQRARRAVAAALVRRADHPAVQAQNAPTFWAWLFVAFALAVAASALWGGWWRLPNY
jgi:hypothetical protein